MEWFMYHTVIVTSTEYENFFDQRCHKDAQPEIRALAELMRDAYEESTPSKLLSGDLHAPYTTVDDWIAFDSVGVAKVSSARCARVSYMTHDGVVDREADFRLFERLTSQDPGHWSPLEHVAFAGINSDHPFASGNFEDQWVQLRYIYERGMILSDLSL
jgi:thymidylate synthase ThyX